MVNLYQFQLRRVASLGALILAIALGGCKPESNVESAAKAANDKLLVATTFTVIADMAKNVAGDKATVVSVTKPGAEIHNYQPTPQDIVNAVELLESTSSGNVITAAPSRRSPYFNLVEEDKNGIVRLSKSSNNAVNRRQDSPECYDMNASIYVWERGSLMNNESIFNDYTRMYVMPEERSQDIDSDLDFLIVKTIMENSL